MKVVQINTVSGTGSTGRISESLSQIMTENNIENYIIYGQGHTDYSLSIKIGGGINIRTHQLHTRLLGWHGYASKNATKQLITELQRIKPDIIHLHNIHGFYLNIEILFNYLRVIDIPIIWTLHDCWSFTGHCAHFDYIGCNKWLDGCHDCPQLNSYPVSWFFDRSKYQWKSKKELFRSINDLCVVTPSKWLRGVTNKSFLNNHEIKVIYNGINLNIFKPTETDFVVNNNLLDKYIILGVASGWSSRKGLNYFIEMSNILESKYQIVLVGLSKHQIKELPKNILGIRRTESEKELAGLYSAADVFVNPTLEEVFGMTNIESLACGTPVITFNSGGSPESLNSNCGVVVEKGNLKKLVSAIVEIVNDKEDRKDACISQAKKFDENCKFKEYIEVYKNKLE